MSDQVNHPAYYGGGDNPFEAIKVIEAWQLGFCLGNAVKYISRAGKKDRAKLIEDLQKTLWYMERERFGMGATQPANGLGRFPEEYRPEYVATAWELSTNLSIALIYIGGSRLGNGDFRSLDAAIRYVKLEIAAAEEACHGEICESCKSPLGDDAPLYDDADVCRKCHNDILLGQSAAALVKAKETIKGWHGDVAWDIYEHASPEMKVINSALSALGVKSN